MTLATSSVIFLDFDGVLNRAAHCAQVCADHGIVPPHFFDFFAPYAADAETGLQRRRISVETGPLFLERPLCELVDRLYADTGAALVVVSGWRRFADATILGAVLRAAGLTAPVAGVVDGVKMTHDLRAWGVNEWLREHPEVRTWAVLDDEYQHYGARKRGAWDRMVSPVDGVTIEDCEAVRAILRRFDGGHGDAGDARGVL